VNNITYSSKCVTLTAVSVINFNRHFSNEKIKASSEKGEHHKLKLKEMKKLIKLFLILIVLSVVFCSCMPLDQSRYGDQGYNGRGDRHHRHQREFRDQGERNHYTPRE